MKFPKRVTFLKILVLFVWLSQRPRLRLRQRSVFVWLTQYLRLVAAAKRCVCVLRLWILNANFISVLTQKAAIKDVIYAFILTIFHYLLNNLTLISVDAVSLDADSISTQLPSLSIDASRSRTSQALSLSRSTHLRAHLISKLSLLHSILSSTKAISSFSRWGIVSVLKHLSFKHRWWICCVFHLCQWLVYELGICVVVGSSW